jgi:hypothetical protein
VSHTPKNPVTSFVPKRYLNAKRLRSAGGPPAPPVFPFTLFFGQVQPSTPETLENPALSAHDDFIAYLALTAEIQTWESVALNYRVSEYPVSPTLTLNGCGATVPAVESAPGVPFFVNGTVYYVTDNPGVFSRWNTTVGGANWLESCATPLVTSGVPFMGFDFSPSIAFFGSYFTDFGDWADSWIVIRLIADDNSFTDYSMENAALESGSLTFWGFAANNGVTYKRIEFRNFGPHFDAWGMDDTTWGPVASLVGP